MNRHRTIVALCAALGIAFTLAGMMLVFIPAATAQDGEAVSVSGNNSYCVVCHTAQTDRVVTFANGDQMPIANRIADLADSVHGAEAENGALGCVDCHGMDKFPHTQPLPASYREYRIQQAAICTDCHTEQIESLVDGVHYTALADDNLRAATCIDCHGSHDIQPPDEPRERIAETCGDCHQIVFSEYSESVHGRALAEGDPNVPTCVDCHGVHGIQHPTTALFRNRSPELCATCHGDRELMEEYGLSTHIFSSYLTDFHGTTVALFEQEAPNVASNKAVCYDCHGVHDIARTDAEGGQAIRENLLGVCQQCHPDATADFPDAWVGHFPPTLESNPLLFTVNLFYTVFIPLVLGTFIILVITDIIRRLRERLVRRERQSNDQ